MVDVRLYPTMERVIMAAADWVNQGQTTQLPPLGGVLHRGFHGRSVEV